METGPKATSPESATREGRHRVDLARSHPSSPWTPPPALGFVGVEGKRTVEVDMSRNTQGKPAHRVPRLERTAYNQAGHAVMAVLQGRTFGDVSIIPSEGASGRVDGFALTEDQQNEIAAGPRRRLERHVRSEIMIYYAGHVAERMRTRKLTLRGAEADLAQAAEMATKLHADEATRGAFVLWLWHLTREANNNSSDAEGRSHG